MGDPASELREYARLDRKRRNDILTLQEFERWSALKEMLNRRFQSGAAANKSDRRQSVRVASRLSVSFESRGDVQKCLMQNLSRGGVFISTECPPQIGSRFSLQIIIEKTSERLDVEAEVVSLNTGADLNSNERGMGMRFVNLDESTHKKITELYEQTLKKTIEDL